MHGGRRLSISVVILTFNRLPLLRENLASLLSQTGADDEIIVADTGSTDGTREWVTEQCAPIIPVFLHLQKFDFGVARNLAASHSTREVIAFTDDDSLPSSDWLGKIRSGLLEADSCGGPSLPGHQGDFPWWWHEDLSWLVGNSPPGTVLGLRGFYPDNANLAIHRHELKSRPFLEARPDNHNNVYQSGREDAEWWRQARIDGRKAFINHKQIVFHRFDRKRLNFGLILRRAYTDGAVAWLKRPSATAREVSAYDVSEGVLNTFSRVRPLDLKIGGAIPSLIWTVREFGVFRKSRQDTSRIRALADLRQAFKKSITRRVSRQVFTALKSIQSRPSAWPTCPKTIFVSADGHFGDTIMLRRHVYALAETFPDADITVTARYPVLLQDLPPNIALLPSGTYVSDVAAAIVPYYAYGNTLYWRKVACRVGATFDSDVGFAGQRDYYLAQRRISKNLEVSEHENLRNLFQQWPLKEAIRSPIKAPQVGSDEIFQALPASYIKTGFLAVQFGTGKAITEFPLDRWIPFLQCLVSQIDTPVVLFGNTNWEEAGSIAASELHTGQVLNLVGKLSLNGLIALVCQSRGLIGGCSGPKHLAMEMDIPTFTLYGATEEERWGVTGNHHLHASISALPDRLTGPELAGLHPQHRMQLLTSVDAANATGCHFRNLAC